MQLLFQPFIQCFVELSKILFNYSIPLFEIPLYVFITLPLVLKILLIPVNSSASRMESFTNSSFAYLKSRVEKGKKAVETYRVDSNKAKGKFTGGSPKRNMYESDHKEKLASRFSDVKR